MLATGIRPEFAAILQLPIVRTTVAVAGCSPDQEKPNSLLCFQERAALQLIKGGWNFTYSFQQYLWMNPDVPGSGWGVFGQIGKSDGNPTPLDWSGFIGLTGNPLSTRPQDRFGVAYFRQSFSNVLARSLSPVIRLRDEQGLEAFYTAALGKPFRLTGNVQVIRPALSQRSTAVVLGLRVKAGL